MNWKHKYVYQSSLPNAFNKNSLSTVAVASAATDTNKSIFKKMKAYSLLKYIFSWRIIQYTMSMSRTLSECFLAYRMRQSQIRVIIDDRKSVWYSTNFRYTLKYWAVKLPSDALGGVYLCLILGSIMRIPDKWRLSFLFSNDCRFFIQQRKPNFFAIKMGVGGVGKRNAGNSRHMVFSRISIVLKCMFVN